MAGKEVVGSVAPDQAAERKSIQMKHFRSDAAIRRVISDQTALAVGQVVGFAVAAKEKTGSLPDGTASRSVLIIGDFEATNYETGEIMSSTGIYLPAYFAETVQAALDKSPQGIAFAIELICEPTGAGISDGKPLYNWGVKRLLARQADSPLEHMKRQLAAKGTLRLPAPASAASAEVDPLALPAANEPEVPEDGEAENPATVEGNSANGGQGGQEAVPAKEGKGHRKAA